MTWKSWSLHQIGARVFGRLWYLFAMFVSLCGTGHLIDGATSWVPIFWTLGWVKLATAVVSWWTVVAIHKELMRA